MKQLGKAPQNFSLLFLISIEKVSLGFGSVSNF